MPLALGLSPTGWSRWSGPTESWGGGSLRQKVFPFPRDSPIELSK